MPLRNFSNYFTSRQGAMPQTISFYVNIVTTTYFSQYLNPPDIFARSLDNVRVTLRFLLYITQE